MNSEHLTYESTGPIHDCERSLVERQPFQPTWDSLDRRPTPAWFSDAKFGIFIHWGVYSVARLRASAAGQAGVRGMVLACDDGRAAGSANPVYAGTWAFHQRVYGSEYPYQNFAPQFRAELFDPNRWADVFQRSGAKYVVLTSKHHEPAIIFSDGEWDLPSTEWRTPELLAWLFNESAVKTDVVINDRWGKESRHKHGGYWTTEYTPGMSGSDHPWEESRGMAFSYRYNRAERARITIQAASSLSCSRHRKPGRQLLLDIGPAADRTIPVVMEERLLKIGSWLKVNGEAIYGTRPWKTAKRWSTGEVPRVDYNKEFETAYDVSKLTEKPEPGKASIEAFFTAKGADMFVILPRWPGRQFTIKDTGPIHPKSAKLLGSAMPLRWNAGANSLALELPEFPEELLRQPAWVLKISQ